MIRQLASRSCETIQNVFKSYEMTQNYTIFFCLKEGICQKVLCNNLNLFDNDDLGYSRGWGMIYGEIMLITYVIGHLLNNPHLIALSADKNQIAICR